MLRAKELFDRGCIDFEKCSGCDRITPFELNNGAFVRGCSVYLYPGYWWRRGGCPFSNAWQIEIKPKTKVRVGQQKQRKGI